MKKNYRPLLSKICCQIRGPSDGCALRGCAGADGRNSIAKGPPQFYGDHIALGNEAQVWLCDQALRVNVGSPDGILTNAGLFPDRPFGRRSYQSGIEFQKSLFWLFRNRLKNCHPSSELILADQHIYGTICKIDLNEVVILDNADRPAQSGFRDQLQSSLHYAIADSCKSRRDTLQIP